MGKAGPYLQGDVTSLWSPPRAPPKSFPSRPALRCGESELPLTDVRRLPRAAAQRCPKVPNPDLPGSPYELPVPVSVGVTGFAQSHAHRPMVEDTCRSGEGVSGRS